MTRVNKVDSNIDGLSEYDEIAHNFNNVFHDDFSPNNKQFHDNSMLSLHNMLLGSDDVNYDYVVSVTDIENAVARSSRAGRRPFQRPRSRTLD